MSIARWFRLLCLRWQHVWLQAQLEDKHELLLDHTLRFADLCERVRKVRAQIDMLTPAEKVIRNAGRVA